MTMPPSVSSPLGPGRPLVVAIAVSVVIARYASVRRRMRQLCSGLSNTGKFLVNMRHQRTGFWRQIR